MLKAGTRVFQKLPVFSVEPWSLQAFRLATLSAVVAFIARYGIGILDATVPPFAPFLVATVLTAILGGAVTGTVCATLSLILAWVGFQPYIPTAFSWIGIAQYLVSCALIIWIAVEYRQLLHGNQLRENATARQKQLIEAENQSLTLIASDTFLSETLTNIVRTIEQYSESDLVASILLLDADGEHLRHGAAPSLPDEYIGAIDGLKIGEGVGSCGTAAFRAAPVFVADIQTDPLWSGFRELARKHRLAACWSTPIMSRNNTVLGTFAIYRRRPSEPDAHDVEIVNLLVKTAVLAIERERELEQRQLLLEEFSHRTKNSFAVISSIASSTLKPHVARSNYTDFESRVQALASVQSLLTRSNWQAIDVLDLIKNVATAPFNSGGSKFRFEGKSVLLPSQLVLPFSLAIHELCTNASKYGALSNDNGTVNLSWGFQQGQLYLRWVEQGGPAVLEPKRRGFGSKMISMAFARAAGGEAIWRYPTKGVECEITIPAEALIVDAQSGLNQPGREAEPSPA